MIVAPGGHSDRLPRGTPKLSTMGLLSRLTNPSSKGAVPRGRIRLRPEELKESNRITPKEQLAGYAVALIEAVTVVFVALRGGLVSHEKISLPLMAAASVAFAVCVWKTNRLGAMLGALGVFALWAARFPLDVLFAYPLMGYMLYLTLVSTKSRQKIQAQRLATGDTADGMEEARAARKSKKPEYATTDSAGKALPPKSSRYTPPKVAKKR